MNVNQVIESEIQKHKRAITGLESALAALNGNHAVRHVRHNARVSTRRLVLRTLTKAGEPLSALQIHEAVRKRGHDLSWRACWSAVRKLHVAKEVRRVRRGVYAIQTQT